VCQRKTAAAGYPQAIACVQAQGLCIASGTRIAACVGMRRSSLWLLAAFAFPLLLGDCWVEPSSDGGCTMMGCETGFTVRLQSSAWPTGAYRVELEAEGRSIVCTAAIPLPTGDPGKVCDADDVSLGLSGSLLPVAQQSLSEVRFFKTFPKQVRIVVLRDSVKLAEQVFTPTYQTSQPNGPSCEPTCTNASAALAW
jgi:hypothetical protein